MTAATTRLGLRENAGQFALLVGLNAFVGAMVGLERSVLPLVGERDFDLASKSGDPQLRRRLRDREGSSRTWPPAGSPTASAASACSSSAGCSLCPCRC